MRITSVNSKIGKIVAGESIDTMINEEGYKTSNQKTMTTKQKSVTIKYTNLYEEAQRRYSELLLVREAKQAAIEKAPPGKIHIINSHNRTQFYLRKDKKDKSGQYIPKSKIATAKLYAQKAYDEKILKLINCECRNLEKFLKQSDNILSKIQRVYSDDRAEVKVLINPVDVSDEDYKNAWLGIAYEGKEISDRVPCYTTKRKERVRSKSELNIANALADLGIPYKYECPLRLSNGAVIHPDFTILDVKRRRELYWEHRGMMDDREYAKNTVARVKLLMRNGILLGKNLIITEETANNPLGTNEIETVIKAYFGEQG